MKLVVGLALTILFLGASPLSSGIYDELEAMHYQHNRQMTLRYGNPANVTTVPNWWLVQHCSW